MRRTLTDPAVRTYLAQVARSGYVEWSRLGPQPPMGFVVHTVATFLVNRLVFWGGWTVVVWQGDAIAPKRRTVGSGGIAPSSRRLTPWSNWR